MIKSEQTLDLAIEAYFCDLKETNILHTCRPSIKVYSCVYSQISNSYHLLRLYYLYLAPYAKNCQLCSPFLIILLCFIINVLGACGLVMMLTSRRLNQAYSTCTATTSGGPCVPSVCLRLSSSVCPPFTSEGGDLQRQRFGAGSDAMSCSALKR